MSLTGLKDVDREILKWVDDKDLLEICTVDRKTWNEVCDDNFLKRRLNKYPGIEKFKNSDESWKRFILRVVYYTTIMRDEFGFQYSEGNFKSQFDLLKIKMNNDKNFLLISSSQAGELSLIKYAIENGADLHYDNDGALSYASRGGHLDVVKWLTENGADIHTEDNLPVGWASQGGHLDVVKYLVDKGADIHAEREYALREAAEEGRLPVVKYLVEHGADIHAHNDTALIQASHNGHTDIVRYLLENGAFIHDEDDLKYAIEKGNVEIIKLLTNK